jgi:hypothetical protein
MKKKKDKEENRYFGSRLHSPLHITPGIFTHTRLIGITEHLYQKIIEMCDFIMAKINSNYFNQIKFVTNEWIVSIDTIKAGVTEDGLINVFDSSKSFKSMLLELKPEIKNQLQILQISLDSDITNIDSIIEDTIDACNSLMSMLKPLDNIISIDEHNSSLFINLNKEKSEDIKSSEISEIQMLLNNVSESVDMYKEEEDEYPEFYLEEDDKKNELLNSILESFIPSEDWFGFKEDARLIPEGFLDGLPKPSTRGYVPYKGVDEATARALWDARAGPSRASCWGCARVGAGP